MPSHGRGEFKRILGSKIKILRKINNMTQEDLRKALNYESNGTIPQIEGGIIGMTNDKIYEAAKVFGIHPAYLFSPEEFSDEELEMSINLMIILKKGNNSPHLSAIKSLLELAAKG